MNACVLFAVYKKSFKRSFNGGPEKRSPFGLKFQYVVVNIYDIISGKFHLKRMSGLREISNPNLLGTKFHDL